ncbi:MAG: nucleotidyltransferase family protein [Armatimonadetes bacterium]|nr:nucleotidyltransferase family protein [Armatimonadota bacterium]
MENVRARLNRAAALESAGVPYVTVGGNAVAAWVSRVNEAAVRNNTQDVDLLLRRADLSRARSALEGAGFVFRHVAGIDRFLDGPYSTARGATLSVS